MVYHEECRTTGQPHGIFSSDCPHCRVLIDKAEEVARLVVASGVSPRETLHIVNMAMEILIDHHIAPALGPTFYDPDGARNDKDDE